MIWHNFYGSQVRHFFNHLLPVNPALGAITTSTFFELSDSESAMSGNDTDEIVSISTDEDETLDNTTPVVPEPDPIIIDDEDVASDSQPATSHLTGLAPQLTLELLNVDSESEVGTPAKPLWATNTPSLLRHLLIWFCQAVELQGYLCTSCPICLPNQTFLTTWWSRTFWSCATTWSCACSSTLPTSTMDPGSLPCLAICGCHQALYDTAACHCSLVSRPPTSPHMWCFQDLSPDPENWLPQIHHLWQDRIAAGVPCRVHAVFPAPSFGDPGIVQHLLVTQNPIEGQISVLISILDEQTAQPSRTQALMLPAQCNSDQILACVDLQHGSRRHASDSRLVVYFNAIPLTPEHRFLPNFGNHFDIHAGVGDDIADDGAISLLQTKLYGVFDRAIMLLNYAEDNQLQIQSTDADQSTMPSCPTMQQAGFLDQTSPETQMPVPTIIKLAEHITDPSKLTIDFGSVFALQHLITTWNLDIQQAWPDSLSAVTLIQDVWSLPFWRNEHFWHVDFYTDGSHAQARGASAAIIAIAHTAYGPRVLGHKAYKCNGQHAYNGEYSAITFALLWACQISAQTALNGWDPSTISFAFNFDCIAAGYIAAGWWKSTHPHWELIMRSLGQIIQTAHGLPNVTWHHIPAHTGNLWNEMSDQLAKDILHKESDMFDEPWNDWLACPVSKTALQWVWCLPLLLTDQTSRFASTRRPDSDTLYRATVYCVASLDSNTRQSNSPCRAFLRSINGHCQRAHAGRSTASYHRSSTAFTDATVLG